jgi:nitrogen fixation protein NifU and related proteins
MDDLYHQEILDHYHHPDNFGVIDHPDQTIDETNASCGDVFKFYVTLNHPRGEGSKNLLRGGLKGSSDGDSSIIEAVKFIGIGCAISTAACSLLTSYLKGKSISVIKNLDDKFMQSLIGAEISPARLKCLMLPARAVSKLLEKYAS